MDHSFYTDRLSAYFDQELKDEELVMVEEHVKECDECQAILKRMEQFTDFVSDNDALGESEYWEANAKKIESALGFENNTEIIPVKKKSTWKGLSWKLTAAAASLAVLASITLYKSEIFDSIDSLEQSAPAYITDSVDSPSAIGDTVGLIMPAQDIQFDAVKEQRVKESESTDEDSFDERPETETKKSAPQKVTTDNLRETAEPVDRKTEVSNETMAVPPSPVEKQKTTAPQRSAGTTVLEKKKKTKAVELETTAQTEAEAAPDRKTPTSPQLVTPLTTGQDKASLTDTDEDVGKESVSEHELMYWRGVRDSIQLLLNPPKKGRSSKATTKSYSAPSELKEELDKEELQNSLLQAYFEIASFTSDDTEKTEAIKYLEKIAESNDLLAVKAREYLRKLDIAGE